MTARLAPGSPEAQAAAAIAAALASGRAAEAAAAELAAQMNDWLTGHDAGEHPLDHVPSDVVEWCRSARDLLAVMAGQ